MRYHVAKRHGYTDRDTSAFSGSFFGIFEAKLKNPGAETGQGERGGGGAGRGGRGGGGAYLGVKCP